MGAYRAVIGCNFEQYINNTTEPNRYLILDYQEDKQVTNTAVIASQPMQDGDTMSDHMYRQPTEVTLAGSFSLNGKNWDDDSYNFISVGDRLTNIQEAFERILKEGLLCTITTINEDDMMTDEGGKYSGTLKSNARNRFKIRKNMALKNISWTEGQNNIKFNFTFQEVIMVAAQQEYEELSEEEKKRLGLPSVTYPETSNLGTLLTQNDEVLKSILQKLYEKGYIDEEFIKLAQEQYPSADTVLLLLGAVAIVGAAIGLGVALGVGLTVTASIFPVGTLIAGVGLLVAGCCAYIDRCSKEEEEKKKRAKAIKVINNSAEEGIRQLNILLDDVQTALKNLQTGLTIFSIKEDKEQQVALNLGGETVIINFKNRYTDGSKVSWYSKVEDLNGDTIDLYNDWCPVSDIFTLNRTDNLWFQKNGFEVYLVNPSLSSSLNPTEEQLENVKPILTGYSIWVSDGDIKVQLARIAKAIDDTLISKGYE